MGWGRGGYREILGCCFEKNAHVESFEAEKMFEAVIEWLGERTGKGALCDRSYHVAIRQIRLV